MIILKQIQQGDVWIEKIDDLAGHVYNTTKEGWPTRHIIDPISKQNIEFQLGNMPAVRACTIALGEATGHHHQLVTDREAIKVDMDKGIFELMEKAILTHEEHKPIELEAGLYRFGIINEYDYESRQNRQVWD